MRVYHCPSCGSDNIEKESWSAEYSSATSYSCEDCDWNYTNGRGMGVGSNDKGTHPRSVGPSSGQATLTQTGEWCYDCETCAKPGFCRCVEEDDDIICESCMDLSPEEFSKVETGVESVIPLRYGAVELCTTCNVNEADYKVV